MIRTIIKSESIKFYTHKWLILSICGLAFFLPSMALVLNPTSSFVDLSFVSNTILQSFYLGQAFFIVISVLFFGQEFSHSTLRTSFLCVPKRRNFVFGKIAVLLSFVFVLFILFSLITIFISFIFFQLPLTIANIFSLIKALVPVLFSTLTLSIIASAFTVLSASILVPLSILLPLLLGFGQLLLQFSSIFRYFPVLSVMNGFSLHSLPIYLKIERGLLIQLLWGAFLFLIAQNRLTLKLIR